MHTGSCLCGGIKFRIHAELTPIQVCHCSQCRKAQGGPFATNIAVDQAAVEFVSGQALMRAYESSPGKRRHFCGTCGSPLFSERSALPGVLRIRAGLLDEPLGVGLDFHAFMGSKSSWWPVDEGLPQHEALPPEHATQPAGLPASALK